MSENQIENIITQYFKNNNKQHLLLETRAVEVWKEVVGSFIAQKTRVKQVKAGVMYVSVSDAALRFELNNSRSDIMDKINAHLNSKVVTNIVFQ